MKNMCVFCLVVTASTITSCGDPAAKGSQAIVKGIEKIHLSVSDILDARKIHLFLSSNNSPTKESNDFFMKGIDAYKNKQLLDSAKYYFEHSIQQYPTPNAYYELGNVYKELKVYDNSIMSYKLAEKLNYAPFSNLLFQMAGTFSLKGDNEMAAKHIEYALQAGFTDLEKINSDKGLESLKKNSEYLFINAVKNGTRGMSNPETLFWLQFKKQFIPASYPLTLSGEINVEELDKLGFISYDFERFISEMRNARFSREVGQSYHYAYNIGENENYTALLYIEQDHYVGDFFPKTFILSTFDSKGKLIDKKRIADFGLNSEELVVLQIDKPGEFTAKLYDLEYEKDPEEDGYWENTIKNRNYLTSFRYQIDNKGKITFSRENKSDIALINK